VNFFSQELYVAGGGLASNTLLGNASGSLNTTTYAINYAVDGSHNLTTSGANILIESPYQLDGNVTATGATITTASR